MTTWTDDDELRLSIEMALSKIKTKPRADRDGTYQKNGGRADRRALEAVQLEVREGAAVAAPRLGLRGVEVTSSHTDDASAQGFLSENIEPAIAIGLLLLNVIPGGLIGTLQKMPSRQG